MLHDVPTNSRSLILQSREAFLTTCKMVLLYVSTLYYITTFQCLLFSRPQPAPIIFPLWPTPTLSTLILLPLQPTLILLPLRAPIVIPSLPYQARARFLLTFYHVSFNLNPTSINPQGPSNTRADLSYLFMRPLMFQLLQCRSVSLHLFFNDYG